VEFAKGGAPIDDPAISIFCYTGCGSIVQRSGLVTHNRLDYVRKSIKSLFTVMLKRNIPIGRD
jgi:hypothetical protein